MKAAAAAKCQHEEFAPYSAVKFFLSDIGNK